MTSAKENQTLDDAVSNWGAVQKVERNNKKRVSNLFAKVTLKKAYDIFRNVTLGMVNVQKDNFRKACDVLKKVILRRYVIFQRAHLKKLPRKLKKVTPSEYMTY